MNILTTYTALAVRTAKPLPPDLNLLHAAIGLTAETGELSQSLNCAWMRLPFDAHNISEELGDICWYAGLIAYAQGYTFEGLILDAGDAGEASEVLASAVIGRNPIALQLCLSQFVGQVLTSIKKHVFYEKPLDEHKLRRDLALLVTTLNLQCSIHNLAFEQVLTDNIAKLTARFPDKFSNDSAVAQADKQ